MNLYRSLLFFLGAALLAGCRTAPTPLQATSTPAPATATPRPTAVTATSAPACEAEGLRAVTSEETRSVRWSADGARLYYVTGSEGATWWAYDPLTCTSAQVARSEVPGSPALDAEGFAIPPEAEEHDLSRSPSGNRMLFAEELILSPTPTPHDGEGWGERDVTYDLYLLDKGQEPPTFVGSIDGSIREVIWRPGERSVLIAPFGQMPGSAYLWLADLEERRVEALFPAEPGRPESLFVALAPGGDRFLFKRHGDVYLYDLAARTEEHVPLTLKGSTYVFFLSPDRLLLLDDVEKPLHFQLLAYHVPTSELRRISEEELRIYDAALSPKGDYLAILHEKTRALDLLPLSVPAPGAAGTGDVTISQLLDERVENVTWSEDSAALLFTTRQSNAEGAWKDAWWRYDVASGERAPAEAPYPGVPDALWEQLGAYNPGPFAYVSPDGQRLLYTRVFSQPEPPPGAPPIPQAQVWMADGDGGNARALGKNLICPSINRPQWMAEGGVIFSCGYEGPAEIIWAGPGASPEIRRFDVGLEGEMALSPDEKHLAAIVLYQETRVINLESGQLVANLPGSYAPVWAPDSRSLYFTREVTPDNYFEREIFVYDLDTGTLTSLLRSPFRAPGRDEPYAVFAGPVAPAPSGAALTFHASPGGLWLLQMQP